VHPVEDVHCRSDDDNGLVTPDAAAAAADGKLEKNAARGRELITGALYSSRAARKTDTD